jgi:hypothetical protein
MDIEKDRCYDSSYGDDPTCQAPNAAKTIDWCAEVTVAGRVLVAMTAQPFAGNKDIVHFALCVQFVANVTPATLALELVNVVRGA